MTEDTKVKILKMGFRVKGLVVCVDVLTNDGSVGCPWSLNYVGRLLSRKRVLEDKETIKINVTRYPG